MSSTWVCAGVEIVTASAPAAASSSSESNVAGPGNRSRELRAALGEVVTTPRNSHSAALAISGAWKLRPPNP